MRHKSLLACLALSSGAFAQTASADSYPQLRPRAVLIEILKALDGDIADPRSVSDVILCPPTKVKFGRDGQPESWKVYFSMNSRSVGGGYTGRTMYLANFRASRKTEVFNIQMANDEGLNKLINDDSRKKMKDCPAVSNEQLSVLLGASDRPTVDVSH